MYLLKYLELRRRIESLEGELKQIQDLALVEAMDRLSSSAVDSVVYEDGSSLVSLRLMPKKPKPTENLDLAYLSEALQLEEERSKRQHKDRIEQLEKELESLRTSAKGRKYEEEYRKLERQLTTSQPQLVVRSKATTRCHDQAFDHL